MRWMLVALSVATASAACGRKSADDPGNGLCTVRARGDAATSFVWPPLVGKPPPAPANSWRWINVWATFCKPCVNELPRLLAWRDRFTAAGIAIDFVFLNADVDPADVVAFHKDFPDTPPARLTATMAEPETALPAWWRTLGLTGSATIPIQLLVNPAGKLECIRSGSVEDADYARAEAFLKQPS